MMKQSLKILTVVMYTIAFINLAGIVAIQLTKTANDSMVIISSAVMAISLLTCLFTPKGFEWLISRETPTECV
jgi:hypothetical protein